MWGSGERSALRRPSQLLSSCEGFARFRRRDEAEFGYACTNGDGAVRMFFISELTDPHVESPGYHSISVHVEDVAADDGDVDNPCPRCDLHAFDLPVGEASTYQGADVALSRDGLVDVVVEDGYLPSLGPVLVQLFLGFWEDRTCRSHDCDAQGGSAYEASCKHELFLVG